MAVAFVPVRDRAKFLSDPGLVAKVFPNKYRNANVYLASTVSVCVGCLHARYEDRIPTMITTDPEDRNAKIRYHDDVNDYSEFEHE